MELQYPIVCEKARDIKKIENQIFEWLDLKVEVYFMHLTHLNAKCGRQFLEARNGKNSRMKIIFINPKLDVEADALVTVFFTEKPSKSDGQNIRIGSRRCPYCGAV